MPNIIEEETIFNSPVTFNVSNKVVVDTLVGGFPSVANKSLLLSHAAAAIITDFQDGSIGQTLSILGNGNTTITHGTNIFTNTGANKVLAADVVYRFTFIQTDPSDPTSGKWYEDG